MQRWTSGSAFRSSTKTMPRTDQMRKLTLVPLNAPCWDVDFSPTTRTITIVGPRNCPSIPEIQKICSPMAAKKRSTIKISFLFIAYFWIQISYGQDWWSICLSHNWNETGKIGVCLLYWASFIHIKFHFFPKYKKVIQKNMYHHQYNDYQCGMESKNW